METENGINNDILKTMTAIQEKFSELLKYVTEMSVTIPDANDPVINSKNLKDYRDSLNILLKKYAANHSGKKN